MATAPKANKNLKAVPDAGAAPAPEGNKKLIFIIVGVALLLVIAIAGGAAWFVMNNKHDDHTPKFENKVPVFLTMDTFTVNLQVEDVPQFLQVGMTLQVADDKTADLLRENMPQARNRLLLLLSSKKAAELLTVEGKKKLAEEIIAQMKRPFSPKGSTPEVTDVFFTSFVIQ